MRYFRNLERVDVICDEVLAELDKYSTPKMGSMDQGTADLVNEKLKNTPVNMDTNSREQQKSKEPLPAAQSFSVAEAETKDSGKKNKGAKKPEIKNPGTTNTEVKDSDTKNHEHNAVMKTETTLSTRSSSRRHPENRTQRSDDHMI
ncbi:hypothetical protein DICVIV_07095 [Dictyocaulus viviparus]|uniref:Uncharacterized protein n=1 Tax=Dictyocaulus viviparus TaxID=29172 RepID=A0A0D8XQM6_DICVI|nr:hypothetical protein DICVIV_07095 [Dictyocaulus viviparus]